MLGNKWDDAAIIGEFIKFDQVVGLHIQRGNEAAAYHFSSIEERLEARREAIGRELASLDDWWHGVLERGIDNASNADYYRQRTQVLAAEREHIEQLWQQVRTYMPMEVAA
jgi:hypothetical protein